MAALAGQSLVLGISHLQAHSLLSSSASSQQKTQCLSLNPTQRSRGLRHASVTRHGLGTRFWGSGRSALSSAAGLGLAEGSMFRPNSERKRQRCGPVAVSQLQLSQEEAETEAKNEEEGGRAVYSTSADHSSQTNGSIASATPTRAEADLAAASLAGSAPASGNGYAGSSSSSSSNGAASNGAAARSPSGTSPNGWAAASNGAANGSAVYTNGYAQSVAANVGAAVSAAGNGSATKAVVVEPVKPVGTTTNGAAMSAAGSEDAAQAMAAKMASLGQEGEPSFSQQVKPKVAVTPGGKWNKFKTYSTIQRTVEIWSFALLFVLKVWLGNQKWTYKGDMTEDKKKSRRKELAKWLKEGLLRLGPTFIKIGQQFSTRVDILSPEYVEQLAELQDQVPPFEAAVAVGIVEKELGLPVARVFERFDTEPIAAASLGQVHRARVDGQEVAVKVQRPGLKELFDIDLKNLRVIAQNLQKLDPKSDGAKRDWVAIYDECANVLYQEIDYTQEGQNADRFRTNFASKPYVKVPNIFWKYSTPQVLVMEYVPGVKINNVEALDNLGLDRKRLARYSVEAYLDQILKHGFFHADPHPGNIAVDEKAGGRLIFYDFGMMGSISPNIREGLIEAFYGVYEKDPDKVLDAMVQMGVLVPTGDRTAVRRTAQFFLSSFEERLAAQKKEKEEERQRVLKKLPLTKEQAATKKKKRLAAIGEDLLSIAADQPFRFPATFTFVVRAFSVLDGIGKGLDPAFDISEIAKPYAQELLRFREVGAQLFLNEVGKRWDNQSRAFTNLFAFPNRIEKLSTVINQLEQGELKLRVRTLESERQFKRVAVMQQAIGQGVMAAALFNIATVLHLNARAHWASSAFAASAFFALQLAACLFKVKKLDEREKLITGTA